LKGLNNSLEGKIKELEDELLKLKTNFDHLEMIYKASSEFDSNNLINCENCQTIFNTKTLGIIFWTLYFLIMLDIK